MRPTAGPTCPCAWPKPTCPYRLTLRCVGHPPGGVYRWGRFGHQWERVSFTPYAGPCKPCPG